MTYEESVNYIHGRPKFSARRTDLSKVHRLLERLGSPHKQGKYVHVTGTNGKGSTCAFVHSVLRAAGFKVGLFTSPYLVHFEERFQVNGEPIPKEKLAEITSKIRSVEEQLEAEGYDPATEFEIVTAVGFCYFASCNCDYVVLEVGIGGRLDCTNVIDPPVCACIAPVSLDHQKTLGNTVAEIAADKSGIIKPGSQVVVSAGQPEEAMEVIRKAAQTVGAKLIDASELSLEIKSASRHGTECIVDGVELHVPLLGRHQVDNAVAAYAICKAIGIPVETIQTGIASAVWPARLQYIPGTPDILLDAGHNPAGVATLGKALDDLFTGVPLRVVMGMMSDKATDICIPAVAKRAKRLYACAVDWPRAMPAVELAAVAGAYCPATACQSVKAALDQACAEAEPGEMVLVCGSVYLVGDVLGILQG